MTAELEGEAQLEIGHVLFMDIVGFSKLLVDEQSAFSDRLNQIARNTEQFRTAESAGNLIRLPTGDGMVLVFFTSPEAPVRCAVEIAKALKNGFGLRMGVHSGPVNKTVDVDGRANVAGGGINMAQRVMNCGDAGHILLSKRVAEDLAQYGRWRGHLHDLGEIEVKHGARVGLVNLYTDEVGNPKVPEKVKVAQQQERTLQRRAARKRRNVIVLGALVVTVACAAGYFLWPRAAARKLDRSIAVLPFENRSADKENAYFAGGIQDEILANLAKIGDLKVISRTSVMPYAGKQLNVREIGKALGVTALLEGSVQRIGNRVRVIVQLINAVTDEHIWAENYEREVTDIFAIQRDLALQIASVLRAKLSPEETARLHRRPTPNGEAYLIYLQAQEVIYGSEGTAEDLEKGKQLYQKAIQLDPSFALAFAQLSYMESAVYHSYDSSPAQRVKAQLAANEALRLQPDLPEAHAALGYYYNWCEQDFDRALTELAIAAAAIPNDAEVHGMIGGVKRRQGKWAESIPDLEKSVSLNPKDWFICASLALSYQGLRQFEAAATTLDRAVAANPNFFVIAAVRARLDIAWKGDTTRLEQLLAHTPESSDPDGQATLSRVELKVYQRKYDDAVQAVTKSPLQSFSGWGFSYPYPKSFLTAQAYRLMNNSDKARASFAEAQRFIESAVEQNPQEPARHAFLGQVYAGLGRKDDAIREGKRATELLPESKDALAGPQLTLILAQIYTMVGEFDSALSLLEHSLSTPIGITVPLLKLDPVWDPLRKDPRYQKLLGR